MCSYRVGHHVQSRGSYINTPQYIKYVLYFLGHLVENALFFEKSVDLFIVKLSFVIENNGLGLLIL